MKNADHFAGRRFQPAVVIQSNFKAIVESANYHTVNDEATEKQPCAERS
jgi:hypothetical protein